MSSSRVIKTGNSEDRSISDFCFNIFQRKPYPVFQGGKDGFLPFPLDGALMSQEDDRIASDVEVQVDERLNIAPGMILMSEEDLENRIHNAFTRGVEEERKQADEDLAGICSALTGAISIVSRLREKIIKESEEELLKLSFMVAKKIIRQEIKHDRHILTQLVSEALKEFPDQHEIVVCLHPEDYKVINSNKEVFLAGIDEERQITLKSDEATTLGGCVVESSTGVIDARIEAQLEEIYKCLIEERNMLGEITDSNAQKNQPDKEGRHDVPQC
jgi:flagellar assembly protein FliH